MHKIVYAFLILSFTSFAAQLQEPDQNGQRPVENPVVGPLPVAVAEDPIQTGCVQQGVVSVAAPPAAQGPAGAGPEMTIHRDIVRLLLSMAVVGLVPSGPEMAVLDAFRTAFSSAGPSYVRVNPDALASFLNKVSDLSARTATLSGAALSNAATLSGGTLSSAATYMASPEAQPFLNTLTQAALKHMRDIQDPGVRGFYDFGVFLAGFVLRRDLPPLASQPIPAPPVVPQRRDYYNNYIPPLIIVGTSVALTLVMHLRDYWYSNYQT